MKPKEIYTRTCGTEYNHLQKDGLNPWSHNMWQPSGLPSWRDITAADLAGIFAVLVTLKAVAMQSMRSRKCPHVFSQASLCLAMTLR